MDKISILIADDHTLVRETWSFILNTDPRFSVVAESGGRSWFGGGARGSLEPGSTVVVPIDAERMRPLPLWTAVTTIIYNLAVATAAIGSF